MIDNNFHANDGGGGGSGGGCGSSVMLWAWWLKLKQVNYSNWDRISGKTCRCRLSPFSRTDRWNYWSAPNFCITDKNFLVIYNREWRISLKSHFQFSDEMFAHFVSHKREIKLLQAMQWEVIHWNMTCLHAARLSNIGLFFLSFHLFPSWQPGGAPFSWRCWQQ